MILSFAKVLSACERDCTDGACLTTCQQTFTCLPQKPVFAGDDHIHIGDFDDDNDVNHYNYDVSNILFKTCAHDNDFALYQLEVNF